MQKWIFSHCHSQVVAGVIVFMIPGINIAKNVILQIGLITQICATSSFYQRQAKGLYLALKFLIYPSRN
jgi:hypothetical protein